MKKTLKFLDYVTTHPAAMLTYSAGDMVLIVHGNTVYLCEPKAKQIGQVDISPCRNTEDPAENGTVLNVANFLKPVMSSVAEEEIGTLFLNLRQAIPARTTLVDMGHQQHPMST
jgi:hypothetical protein